MIVTDAIWIRVPLAARRVSRGFAIAASDGIWLASWPWVGLIAPIVGLAAGVFVGAMHPGFEVLFIEALWLLIAIAMVGSLSGAVGLYLTIGFIIGDLALADRPLWTTPLQYLPLLLLAVGVPLAAKSLAAELRLPGSVPDVVRAVVGLGAFVLVTGLLVYAWVKAVPLVLRPVHAWAGELPPRPIILNGRWVVIAAVVAAAGRAVAQALVKGIDFPRARRVVPLWDRVPVMVTLVLRAGLVTLLLAGLYANVVHAVLAFVVVLAAQFVATMLRARGQRGYGIPRLVRIAIAVIPVYLAGMWVLPIFIERRATSFVPMLLLALIAAVLLSVVNPIRERRLAPVSEPPVERDAPAAGGGRDAAAAWESGDTAGWEDWDPPVREPFAKPVAEREEAPVVERGKASRRKGRDAAPVKEPEPEPAPEPEPKPEPQQEVKPKRKREPKREPKQKRKQDSDEELAWWREDVPEGEHRDVV